MWPTKPTPGLKTQLSIAPEGNRLTAYRSITAPVLVIGFEDDVVLPAHLGKEVADAIPNGRYLEIPHTGHLGFIESMIGATGGPDAILTDFARQQLP